MLLAKLILLIPIIYIIVILILFGIQKSISDSYYRYKDTKWKYMFTLFCWTLAYPIMIITANPLMFFAGVLLGITGSSPAFKQDNIVKTSHMIGAYGCILLSQLAIALHYEIYWLNILFIVGSILILVFKNKLPKYYDKKEQKYYTTHFFFIEILALIPIYILII